MMHSHIRQNVWNRYWPAVLILVVMDDALAHYCDASSDDYVYVLILVVMDDALAHTIVMQVQTITSTS